MRKIAVIGAGIGGLAAAHTLNQLSQENDELDVYLFEAADRLGGKIMSERKNGFLCEYGPNSLLDNRPAAMGLCEELGLKDKVLRSNDSARKRFILSKNKLHQLPEGPGSFFGTGLMSISGKLRIIAEIWQAKGDPEKDETIQEFARRRLGDEAYNMLLDPMITGIFAGDPTRMSLKTCFPRIHELEMQYGGLIKAMFKLMWEKKKRGEKSGGPAGPSGSIVAFNEGLQEIIDLLAEELKDITHLNTRITSIKKGGIGYSLTIEKVGSAAEEVLFDKVVICTPTHVMPMMLKDLSEKIACELGKIPYAPVAVVALGYDKKEMKHPLDGFGFLIPGKEKRDILGCLWTSSIFAHRAPDGKALLRLMIGGMRSPELALVSEAELVDIARREVKITMGIDATPVFSNVYKHETAIIQFHVGHEAISNRIKDELKKFPGLEIGCNSFGGIGIDGAVKASIDAAKACIGVE